MRIRNLLSTAENKTIARILKVNHAGEHGAIRIYGAQILIARFLYSSIAERLAEIRQHEIAHCRLLGNAVASCTPMPGHVPVGASCLGREPRSLARA